MQRGETALADFASLTCESTRANAILPIESPGKIGNFAQVGSDPAHHVVISGEPHPQKNRGLLTDQGKVSPLKTAEHSSCTGTEQEL